jgi:hypothetical protein
MPRTAETFSCAGGGSIVNVAGQSSTSSNGSKEFVDAKQNQSQSWSAPAHRAHAGAELHEI